MRVCKRTSPNTNLSTNFGVNYFGPGLTSFFFSFISSSFASSGGGVDPRANDQVSCELCTLRLIIR